MTKLYSQQDGRNQDDAYYTPPALTRALIHRASILGGVAGEPCCGDGWITRELERVCDRVVSSDIVDGVDFFSSEAAKLYRGVDMIVTNPPYDGAARFVRRALELTPNVMMLLRLSFLEGCEKSQKSARLDLLKRLDRVIIMPRVSFFQGGSGTDSSTTAWFIWTRSLHPFKRPYVEWVSERELSEYAGQERLF